MFRQRAEIWLNGAAVCAALFLSPYSFADCLCDDDDEVGCRYSSNLNHNNNT